MNDMDTDNDPFPDTLEGFGYEFNDKGQLRKIGTDEPFKFEVRSGDRRYNQAHYEALGDVIGKHIETALENDYGLRKVAIPIDADEKEPKSKIYMTPNALTTTGPLMLLMPGIRVGVGQWARKIIINDNINSGAVFDYLRQAKEKGYEVIVFNSNENRGSDGESKSAIRGSEDPERHVAYIWENFVMKVASKQIVIVAHSYGGVCLLRLLYDRPDEVAHRVKAIAFTDSVHDARVLRDARPKRWLAEHAVDWITSERPGNTLLSRDTSGSIGCPAVSAGHRLHEYTTVTAKDFIFAYFPRHLGDDEGERDGVNDEGERDGVNDEGERDRVNDENGDS